ncbi:MAG: hypothetical protein WA761_08850 [Thermoplasmata archaeon]
MASESFYLSTGILLAIIVLVIVRRTYRMIQGARASPGYLFGFLGLYLVLLAFTLVSTIVLLPAYSAILDIALVVIAGSAGFPWVLRHVKLEKRANGEWYYRLGPIIPIVYLVLFVTRLVIDLVVLGLDPFDFYGSGTVTLTQTQIDITILVDALFALSTGLLAARSFGVYSAYRKAVAQEPSALSSGGPSRPSP